MSKIAIFIVYADSSFAESLFVKSIDITKITANTTTSIRIIEITVGKSNTLMPIIPATAQIKDKNLISMSFVVYIAP
jgi:hypothetical protein